MKSWALSNLLLSAVVLTACTDMTPRYTVGSDKSNLKKTDAESSFAQQVAGKSFVGIDNDISAPKVVSSRFPDYPQSWRNAGITGNVVVRFSVGIDGSVSDPSVVGSPRPELAAICLHAIMGWKFLPATRDGKPINVIAQQSFEFKTE